MRDDIAETRDIFPQAQPDLAEGQPIDQRQHPDQHGLDLGRALVDQLADGIVGGAGDGGLRVTLGPQAECQRQQQIGGRLDQMVAVLKQEGADRWSRMQEQAHQRAAKALFKKDIALRAGHLGP